MKRIGVFAGLLALTAATLFGGAGAGATDITATNIYTTNLYVTGQPSSAPGQVQGLTVTVGQNTASLAWTPNPASDAVSQYIVQMDGSPVGASSVASYVVRGLQPNTQYTFVVAAVNSMGTGSYSAAVQATTLPEYATPPVGLAVYSATAVEWTANPPTEAIQKYNVYINGTYFDDTAAADYDFTGKNLVQGQSYQVTVTAVNGLGDSQPSQVLDFTYGLATPANLQLYNMGDNHAYIMWSYPNNTTPFVVNVAGQVYDVPAGQMDYQLDGLAPNTNYSITVQAVGPDGQSLSGMSNVLNFTTESTQGFDQVSEIVDAMDNLSNLAVFWTVLAGFMLAFPLAKIVRAAIKIARRPY
ncbi:MAG: fibronectin type III domain-containing protein [Thermoplasmatales archaeon]